jgi:hypothetical protein
MAKTLLYYGLEVENTPIFNSNIKPDIWQNILNHIKQKGQFLYNSKKVYYYKLNNIDIIETLENNKNNKNMYNLSDFKIDVIDNSYMKLQFKEDQIDYIIPEFNYFNKQIHKLQLYTYDNLRICFDEYAEDGNNFYNIYLIVNNDMEIDKYKNIINNICTSV